MKLAVPFARIFKHAVLQPGDHRVLRDFTRSVMLIVDPEALQASIAARIQELFRPERILIFHSEPEKEIFSLGFASGVTAEEVKGAHLRRQGQLARWLLVNETCLVVPEQRGVYEYLNEDEQRLLARFQIRICVPVIALNRLAGVIMLGWSQPDWMLDQSERELLRLLGSQAGLALENAALSRQQQDRLRRLYRAERLAAVGQLAAGVAHEIRNPLTAIRSTIQYILPDYPEDSPKRELIRELLSEVDRIDRTVNGLLSLTRSSPFHPEPVDVVDLLEELLVLVKVQAERQAVRIEEHYDRRPLCVLGEANQLKQLFLNLFVNALQAMPQGGTLSVSVTGSSSAWSPQGWLQIAVRDTGIGIPPENLDKVFDPFFTTKRDGTGLGLFLGYGIVERHGGEIEIQSRVGEGTTLTIRLPLIKHAGERVGAAKESGR